MQTTLLAGFACFGMITASQAAVTVTNNSSSGAFSVSNSDLIEGVIGVVGPGSLNGNEGTSSNPAILTNGTFGTGGNPLDTAETVAIGSNVTITWQLDTGLSSAGYDISGVNVYSGWRDAGRDRIDYTARYALVSNPGVFIDIFTVNNFNPSPSNSGESLLTDTLGTIASGVGEIQITFLNQENGYVGYREVDVIGTAIPEPSTTALLGLGGLALAFRRRK